MKRQMFKLRSMLTVLGMLLVLAPTMMAAAPVRLAESTVYQYGGPETRTRCVQEAKTKGIPSCRFEGFSVKCDDTWISACVGWATDFQQHSYVVVMYGTPDMDPKQVETIKASCLASAVATQVIGLAFAADTVAQLLASRRPIMEATFLTCLKTTEALGQLVVSDFRLEVERKDFW